MDTPSAVLSWNCPKCGRRVPNKVSSCRCGFEQQGAPSPLNPNVGQLAPERPLGRPLLLELIVVLALAAAGFVAGVLYVARS